MVAPRFIGEGQWCLHAQAIFGYPVSPELLAQLEQGDIAHLG